MTAAAFRYPPMLACALPTLPLYLGDPCVNLPCSIRSPYLIPDTKFPITLYITEGAPLSLRKSATAFQAMMELMAVISARDQDMVYPGAYAPYIYLDCQVMVDNPALQHEMTYYVAIQSLKGLGEYMLEHEGDRGYVARVGVDGYQVGLVDLRHAELAEQ